MSAQEVVLITGAASGIGRETAFAFAEQRATLVLCDVDAEGLARTAALSGDLGARGVDTHVVDVGSREQMKAFAAAVHAKRGAVDVLVNNAGVGLGGAFLETDLDSCEWIVRINVMGVVHGCHFFVPAMVERRRGHVVNVSSAAGFFPSKALGMYSATKFAVLGLSESLRAELHGSGVGVSAICPGIINTSIVKTSRMVGKLGGAGMRERVVGLYARRGFGPDKVASAIVDAVRKNRAVVPVAPEAWALYYLRRFAPDLAEVISRRDV